MILREMQNLSIVVSHTTRTKRINEIDGKDYHFVSKQEFQEMIDNGQFVEYVECFGNLYGTSLSSIDEALKSHDSCIMDLEWRGGFNILHNQKITRTRLTGILILPPSIKTLKNRLNNRKSETSESLERRIRESFTVDKIAKYDHIIVNKNLDTAIRELRDILYGNQ